jgi:hypothetical protein
MAVLGLFSDSDGDLVRFDTALRLLAEKGAKRFLFAGGRYTDLDDWVKWKREEIKAQVDYSNSDFLDDVKRFLIGLEQLERPAAFGTMWELGRSIEELTRLKDRVIRTPERGSLMYLNASVPKKAVDMLGTTLCCVVHDKNDLDKEDMINAAVLVHGNEPEPRLVKIGPRFFVTPGKLSGATPTVALLDIGDALTFSAFTLEGAPFGEPQSVDLAAKSKVSVK